MIAGLTTKERKNVDEDIDEDEQRTGIREGETERESLFRKCKNTMHVVLHILADSRLQKVTRLLFSFAKPLRQRL